MECDYDGDGDVDMCEAHLCIVDIENAWRAESCPSDYPMIYCDCPFEVVENTDYCEGEWTCDDIYYIAIDTINMYDTNYDG